MVVPVLMINCHVSENPKDGPVAVQTRTASAEATKAQGLPAARAIHVKAVKVYLTCTLKRSSFGVELL